MIVMAVVTISGQTGSGGQEIGREAAQLLGYGLVDRELLAEAARRTGIGLQQWTAHDMRLATTAERVAHIFQSFLEKSAIGYPGDPYLGGEPLLSRTYEQMAGASTTPEQHLDDQRFLTVTTTIIRELAEIGNVVIIGRGASYILHGHPRAFHVLTIAPREYRVRTVMDRERMTKEQAEHEVASQELHRTAYLQKFFHVDPMDPTAFDLVLQTGRLNLRQYAEMIALGVEALDARVVGGA